MCIGPHREITKRLVKGIHDALKKADLKDNVEIFLMGDFNIDMNSKQAQATRELLATASFWGLRALIAENTRIGTVGGKCTGSCIDKITFSPTQIIFRGRAF